MPFTFFYQCYLHGLLMKPLDMDADNPVFCLSFIQKGVRPLNPIEIAIDIAVARYLATNPGFSKEENKND